MPPLGPHLVPSAGHRLERRLLGSKQRELRVPALLGRIDTRHHLLASQVPGCSSFGERHLRVQAQGELLLPAAEQVLPPPRPASGRGDEHVKGVAVTDLVLAVAGDQVAQLQVGQPTTELEVRRRVGVSDMGVLQAIEKNTPLRLASIPRLVPR